jgi:hypothetical protein
MGKFSHNPSARAAMQDLNRLLALVSLLVTFGPLTLPAQSAETAAAPPARAASPRAVPSLDEVAAANQDLWGLAAMQQPNGPSYEFFEPLLPPARYVNADFRYYPILLSAPNARVKARLISNGSGINLRGGTRSWNDPGTPATFRVGPDEFLFGGERERVTHPTLAEGWLPIVEIRYLHPSPLQAGGNVGLTEPKPVVPPEIYRLEAFASTEPGLVSNGVVFARFELAQGPNGHVSVQVDARRPVHFVEGKIVDDAGNVLALFGPGWRWERQLATAQLKPGTSVVLAIPTKPLAAETPLQCSLQVYAAQREACAQTWRDLLAQGMQVETPEPVVNHAWRNLLVQNFQMINGDSIHYSAGNQYDKLYESEGSDALLSFLVWGFEKDTRRLIVPLLDFSRKDLEFHQAGFKLNDVSRYYWQTREAQSVRELQPRWEKEARLLAQNRTNDVSLCPKQQYCGDISTMVYSLTVNAKGWRALRDLSSVLAETGELDEANRYLENAAEFKKSVLAALEKSVRRDSSPPFVPVALYSDEPTHDPITASRIGGYWNIIVGYVVSSGIFPPGSEQETWIPRFQEDHGGLCMGMLRAGGGYTFWNSPVRINPLYGTRYALDTLRRDEPERALVSFYGMLAHGLTRSTFIGAEGSSLTPLDDGGRFMYCPPNSAANAHWLSMLRYLLVQDWDLDDDGKPETLRLLFGTPKRWLEDGKVLKLEHAPTAFGPVSMRVESKLNQGKVMATLELPQRNLPKLTLLRIRVPDGWRVASTKTDVGTLKVDERGTTDISSLRGHVALEFDVARSK